MFQHGTSGLIPALSSYSRELLFVICNSADWRTCVTLLKNIYSFHLGNALGRKLGADLPFTATPRFGASRNVGIKIRPFSGDLFVLYEVLLHRCYDLPDTLLPPEGVRVILDCGANVGITALYFAWRYPKRYKHRHRQDRHDRPHKSTGGLRAAHWVRGCS